MGVVNMPATLRLLVCVEAEKNPDGLPPIRAVPRGIEEPQVKHHMLAVIRGERLARRWFVKECWCWLGHFSPEFSRSAFANRHTNHIS